jgi:hypothetical protein
MIGKSVKMFLASLMLLASFEILEAAGPRDPRNAGGASERVAECDTHYSGTCVPN